MTSEAETQHDPKPNDPGREATGDGPEEMLEENLEQQRPGAKLSEAEADYNKRSGR
jgi:hypothetical protein